MVQGNTKSSEVWIQQCSAFSPQRDMTSLGDTSKRKTGKTGGRASGNEIS